MDELIHRLRRNGLADRAVPLSIAALSKAEVALGFPLPTLLRSLYLAVGDCGYGPGHGFLPLNPIDQDEPSVVALYLDLRRSIPENPLWDWPARLLPFCDWGCAMYSCLDCSADNGPVFTFEYVDDAPASASLAPTRSSFAAYVADWIDGKPVFEPVYVDAPERSSTGVNPFTKQPMVFMGRKPRFWP